MTEITVLIEQAQKGDRKASEALFAALYDELKRLARYQVNGSNAPMQATSLVHEAYCKLARAATLTINDRQHFYATAARVMRQVVLDAVRARDAQRRGGEFQMVALDTLVLHGAAADQPGEDVLAMDAALSELEQRDADLARLVELRFYGGLELSEISALTDRSESSLKRDWRRARAFLYARISEDRRENSKGTPQ
ncbi:MAG: sigma-70 family RNA polymerase sigma factor [Wenzhouxiangella sp.]|nr:sigma-70 family RNA polymerase sigma factor [Wenzhouxiangella sp.]MCH8477036.1 sigma-70 family RNA polymerase sigma factor [Wenzhouxiangella sp.]